MNFDSQIPLEHSDSMGFEAACICGNNCFLTCSTNCMTACSQLCSNGCGNSCKIYAICANFSG